LADFAKWSKLGSTHAVGTFHAFAWTVGVGRANRFFVLVLVFVFVFVLDVVFALVLASLSLRGLRIVERAQPKQQGSHATGHAPEAAAGPGIKLICVHLVFSWSGTSS